ncbi:phosphonoacetaldehyde hydrolase [Companilactobacillus nantensis]|uniref:Phosphonoacetaldehyde hydrolase n=1 Tax=Companilactobacillus nantensis DSM 16982 TaxID=1423774 RepID=A0A0R1WKW9_9LACO|nr:phosphonoacetaldehyde hydrolase [Companilactobacillus nantensis]KRM18069.1 phosphonoacetaldehyde hydrolase [Companilactobacillus nantensis DSM 16982]GEO63710.1 phosphonoacetaldehyde hydrolase [Companilactobacillus nantensis]
MIEAVIFDWAGTTVDYGSLAPVIAFKKAFKDAGIELSDDDIRQDMGMAKWDHIGKILELDDVKQQWEQKYSTKPNDDDRKKIYADFQEALLRYLKESTELKSGVLKTFNYLKEYGIKVATTTGYTAEMMEIVEDKAAEAGYTPDMVVTSEDVNGLGRPSPAMIQFIMKKFNIDDPKKIIKVGDTLVDVDEGQNAGVKTVGIVEGSSLMGLSQIEFDELSIEEQISKRNDVKRKFESVNTDFVIDNIFDLVQIIEYLNESMDKKW